MIIKCLIALLIIFASIDIYAEPLQKDPPLTKFKDSDYTCDDMQLRKARDKFSKCDNTPIQRECYAKYIMMICDKKGWLR